MKHGLIYFVLLYVCNVLRFYHTKCGKQFLAKTVKSWLQDLWFKMVHWCINYAKMSLAFYVYACVINGK